MIAKGKLGSSVLIKNTGTTIWAIRNRERWRYFGKPAGLERHAVTAVLRLTLSSGGDSDHNAVVVWCQVSIHHLTLHLPLYMQSARCFDK